MGNESGDSLQQLAVLSSKRGGLVTVDVDFAQDTASVEDRHHDFRARFQAAGQVPRVSVYIIYNNGLAGGSRGAADALAQRNPRMWGGFALEWTQQQFFSLEQVETHPVILRALAVQQFCHLGQQRSGVRQFGDEVSDGLENLQTIHDRPQLLNAPIVDDLHLMILTGQRKGLNSNHGKEWRLPLGNHLLGRPWWVEHFAD